MGDFDYPPPDSHTKNEVLDRLRAFQQGDDWDQAPNGYPGRGRHNRGYDEDVQDNYDRRPPKQGYRGWDKPQNQGYQDRDRDDEVPTENYQNRNRGRYDYPNHEREWQKPSNRYQDREWEGYSTKRTNRLNAWDGFSGYESRRTKGSRYRDDRYRSHRSRHNEENVFKSCGRAFQQCTRGYVKCSETLVQYMEKGFYQ